MALRERIVKVLITGDASSFNKAVSQVEGSTRKMSAGVKAAIAGVSLAAIGKGAFDAVKGFENAALAARDFSVASGLSGEQAARWQEASSSVGVEAKSLATSIGRLSKNLGGNEKKFADLGVTVARTADGQVDANKTFLNAIQVLHDTQDPLKRATLASQLFGKSWQDLAPLIEMGAAGISTELANVSDAQAKVGSAENIDKAKKFQASMDSMHDAVTQLQFGLASGLVPIISTFASIIGNLNPTVMTAGIAILGVVVAVGKLSGAMAFLVANPWVAIIGAIAGAALLLAANWDKVTAAANAASKAMSNLPGVGLLANVLGLSKSPTGLGQRTKDLIAQGKIQGFATGGMVPGPVGMPQLAVVHGGERVLTPEQQRGGDTWVVNIYGATDGVRLARELQREQERKARAGR